MRNQMPVDFVADISIAVKVFSAHLHKAEPHLQTLDLVVFNWRRHPGNWLPGKSFRLSSFS